MAIRAPTQPRPVMLGSEPCTLVTGSAGSGKSALLVQWFDQLTNDGQTPLWLTAVAGRREDCSKREAALVGSGTLFIDDADHLEPTVVEGLLRDMARDRLSGPRRVVLAARSLPDRLLDWSLHLPIRTVDVDDLPLPSGVVSEILRTYQPGLGDEQIETLTAKIQNWPAAAHLAGQAISKPGADVGVADRFDGQDVGVTDYLDTEVFGGLDRADQHLLVTSSVLDRLTPEACAMLSGDHLTSDRLNRLCRQHVLVSAHDGVWKWRPLAKSYLLGKLRLWPADQVNELHRRARGWSTAQRSYPDAMANAGKAADWNALVRLILDIGMGTVASGEGERVLGWIDDLPNARRRSEPGIAVIAAMAWWTTSGDDARDTIDDWLRYATATGPGRPPAGAASTGSAIAVTRSLFGSVDRDERLRLALPPPIDRTEDRSWAALRCSALGIAAYLNDDIKTARTVLSESLRLHAPGTGVTSAAADWFMPLLGGSILGLLAMIDQDAGEQDRPNILLSMAGLHEPSPAETTMGTGLVALARARQPRPDGDIDSAVSDLAAVGRCAGFHWVRVLALTEAAELHRRSDEPTDRWTSLEAADRLLDAMSDRPPLLARLRENAAKEPQISSCGSGSEDDLTTRELEVLRLLDTDLTRRQIASQMFLAHNTVKTYIQRLYQKLGVSSRPAALSKARERGWLP